MSLLHATDGRPTLAAVLWPEASGPSTRVSPALRNAALALGGTLLLWLSAKVQIPLYPVPVTMQTLVVLVLGVAYGWRLGAATIALYLVEGALGLPVFAGGWSSGGGFHLLYGPTGGYLLGFVVAAGVCGRLAEQGWDRNLWTAGAAMVIGNLIIYALGLAWLAIQIGLAGAITYGLMPFLLGDALKIVLGAAALPAAWQALGRPRDRRRA
jgi:biotin transport system substrate-specific component